MEKSNEIKDISASLLNFQVKCSKIIKKSENPFFKSKYADLPSILDEIATPLQECGLVVSQFPDGEGLTTILIHPESGQWFSATGIMHPVKNDPQSWGSAITYQRRYSLCAILGLNVDSDDDGNEASKPASKPKPAIKPWLNKNTPELTKSLAFIQKATDKVAAMETLLSHYSISKEVKELLK